MTLRQNKIGEPVSFIIRHCHIFGAIPLKREKRLHTGTYYWRIIHSLLLPQ